MAKRLHQIAKELGVDSKVIVAKCQAEGIPETVVKGHMSAISVGLEATIREWFSGAEGQSSATAVETAEKVDLSHAKTKVGRAKSKKSEDGHHGDDPGDAGSTAVTTEAAPEAKTVPTAPHATPSHSVKPPATSAHPPITTVVVPHGPSTPLPGAHGHTVEAKPKPIETIQSDVEEPHARATPIAPSVTPPKPVGPPPTRTAAPLPPQHHAPQHHTHRDAAFGTEHATDGGNKHTDPVRPAASVASPQRPTPGMHGPSHGTTPASPGRDDEGTAPALPTSGNTGVNTAGNSGGSTGGTRPSSYPPLMPGRPGGPNAPLSKPAPMNIPVRPTSVSPAGPRLGAPTAVKLSGPKVVRVEAPENLPAPRPRGPRPAGAGPTGPRTGGGVAGAPGGEDDHSRSPRRKDAAGSNSGPGAKRSTGAGVPERRRARSGQEWIGSTQGVFSEQDLIEREERLARAGGFLKKRKQDLKRPGQPGAGQAEQAEGRIKISAPFTIKDLSEKTGVKAAEIVKKLFMQGIMKKINDPIEVEKAIEVMMDFDLDLEVTQTQTAEETVSSEFEKRETKDLRSRGPVVTILGHVDHGKTSLLDKIRNANVAAGEAGGITQKTSAFRAEVEVAGEKKQIVFLDTPGHEAFTSMRARGAKITDVVVLVVSAPEGVMPQTVESINHAKAAGVPIVVALNKIDRPDATENQIQKTLGELAKNGLNPTLWGGDIEVVKTSATTGEGIKELLETLDYQSQLKDMKADFGGPAQGTVIESKQEEGRGATATLLVQQGCLKVGDFIVAGRAFGRVRDISDDRGTKIREATPPMPVQISGINVIPDAGDKFYVVDTLKKAQEAAEQRQQRERQVQLAQPKVTLDNIFSQITTTTVKEIRIILKTDQQGTVDVLKAECEKIKHDEIKVSVIDAAVGGITESNVLLADASKAIIIGFNVIPSGKARQLAEQKGVEIRTYQVIYDITDDIKKAAEGLLAPEVREEVLGHADVRQVFKISKVGAIAGCYVTDGTVLRDALIRVTRNGIVIEHDRKLAQLKRVKDDAKEVRAGIECGMKIDGYDDIKEGDVLECYKKVEIKRTL